MSGWFWRGREVTLLVVGGQAGVAVIGAGLAAWWASRLSWWLAPWVFFSGAVVLLLIVSWVFGKFWPPRNDGGR